MLSAAFTSLFTVNMGIKKGESILVFSDTIRAEEKPSLDDVDRRERLFKTAAEAAAFADKTYGNTVFISFPATPASGAEPPVEVWRAAMGNRTVDKLEEAGILARLLNKTTMADDLAAAEEIVLANKETVTDIIIALSNNSTSHTRFRSLVTSAGARFASLPHFDPDMFLSSMQVDWYALAERTDKLAKEVNLAVTMELTTPNGTRMLIGKLGRTAKGDDGLLIDPGSFGNLPAGEVYLAPLEGTSEGTMVLEYGPTHKLVTPLELIVKDGRVVEIRGDEPHRLKLEQKFAESELNRNIAELGIGTNDKAKRPDNILEAEKILGTVHIALGDNSGFGGTVSTPFHEDYVFYRPTLTAILADGTRKTLLCNGELTI